MSRRIASRGKRSWRGSAVWAGSRAAPRRGRDLLGEDLVRLPVELEADAEGEAQEPSRREPHVVQRIPVEDVQVQREHLDVVEAAELEHLVQAVLGERVEVVEVLRQRLRAR